MKYRKKHGSYCIDFKRKKWKYDRLYLHLSHETNVFDNIVDNTEIVRLK